jgi:hypothetical protein
MKEERCEDCELSEWMGTKIPLELHHIDGNNENNNLDNLEILCPNCHALTDTYCRKKSSLETCHKKMKIIENVKTDLRKKLTSNRKKVHLNKRKVNRPDHLTLIKEIKDLGYSGTGRKYDVSDNAIRKWIKYYNKNENAES